MIDHSVVRPIEASGTIRPNSKGMPKRILLLDINEDSQERRARIFRQRGIEVTCADDIEQARLLWQEDTYSLVMIDAKDIHDDALAFYRSIKDKRPKQLAKFLVGRPGLLADSPLEDEGSMIAGEKISIMKNVQAVPDGSDRDSPDTGIKSASSQILKRRSRSELQSADPAIPKLSKELSFGDAVRRAGGE